MRVCTKLLFLKRFQNASRYILNSLYFTHVENTLEEQNKQTEKYGYVLAMT